MRFRLLWMHCNCNSLILCVWCFGYTACAPNNTDSSLTINVLSIKFISRNISISFRRHLCVSTELTFIYFTGKKGNDPTVLIFKILKFSLVTEENTMRKTGITKKQPLVKLMAKLCVTEFTYDELSSFIFCTNMYCRGHVENYRCFLIMKKPTF